MGGNYQPGAEWKHVVMKCKRSAASKPCLLLAVLHLRLCSQQQLKLAARMLSSSPTPSTWRQHGNSWQTSSHWCLSKMAAFWISMRRRCVQQGTAQLQRHCSSLQCMNSIQGRGKHTSTSENSRSKLPMAAVVECNKNIYIYSFVAAIVDCCKAKSSVVRCLQCRLVTC